MIIDEKRFTQEVENFYKEVKKVLPKCEKLLFNPDGKDDGKLVCGDTTNILDVAKPKHQVFLDLFFKAYSNNWLPDKVGNMNSDKYDYYNRLTPDEKEAYNAILSFLIFLDSVQTNNLPNISEHITVPEIVLFLVRQAFDEGLHSYSYSYTGNSIMPIDEFRAIIYKWRELDVLRNRNKFIAGLYDIYKRKNDKKAFLVLLIANYLLEGVYFYNGFAFFHNLASRGLMIGTNTQIRYIRRDEAVHCRAFKHLIRIFREENPEDFDTDIIYSLFKEAVEHELLFSKTVIGNKILGMSEQTIEDYTYHLANQRLKDIGVEPIFPKRKNPYTHLDRLAAVDGKEDESKNKENVFETSGIGYKDPYAIFEKFADVDSWF